MADGGAGGRASRAVVTVPHRRRARLPAPAEELPGAQGKGATLRQAPDVMR